MKVWWCRTHFIADASEPLPAFCWLSLATRNPLPCEFVEMQLVPADARVVSEATIEELIAELRTRGAEGVVRIEYIGPPGEPFYVEAELPKDPWDYLADLAEEDL